MSYLLTYKHKTNTFFVDHWIALTSTPHSPSPSQPIYKPCNIFTKLCIFTQKKKMQRENSKWSNISSSNLIVITTSIIELSRSAKAAATQPWKKLTCFSASKFLREKKNENQTIQKTRPMKLTATLSNTLHKHYYHNHLRHKNQSTAQRKSLFYHCQRNQNRY